jgi:hypothetical protein
MPLAIVQVYRELRNESAECVDFLWGLHVFGGVLVAILLTILALLWSFHALYCVLVVAACVWWALGWAGLCTLRRLCSFDEVQDRLALIRHDADS